MSDDLTRLRSHGRQRVRSGLRRHGVLPRPAELRRTLSARDLRFTRGNTAELFVDGSLALAAMRAAIATARKRIHLETYILRTDETGRGFLEALCERARAGVEVRLLFDAVGSLGLDPSPLEDLRRAGGDWVAFNPLSRIYPRWAPRRRDHRKVLVIDGRVAFTGGLNIGDEYASEIDSPGSVRLPWRDAHVRVEGPVVSVLEAVFLESWFRADGPDQPWTEPRASATSTGPESVAVLSDGPSYRRRRMRELLVAALGRARTHVRIATPYFIPGPRLLAALEDAAARGVVVDLLLAGATDHPILRWAAHALLPRLLRSGVRVYEVEHAMMHAKVAVFDGQWAILGTSNLDRQSLEHSYEVNLVFAEGTLPGKLAAWLDGDAAGARPLAGPELARRGLLRRLRNRAAAFLLTRL